MTSEEFWTLIQRSATATNSQRERTEWLTGQRAPARRGWLLHDHGLFTALFAGNNP